MAKQVGVNHGVIRLPESKDFDLTNKSHWQTVYDNFVNFGITPIVIEPLPNQLHDHIKKGDEKRDECISKLIKMFELMDHFNIRTLCFNFMAHIGWLRTKNDIIERGGALVTGFDQKDFVPLDDFSISKEALWENYEYFIKAVIEYAEKYGILLALHPDDPPVEKLGNVSRIMTSFENINKAVNIVSSPNLGVTMCQATYSAMGENLEKVIEHFANENKIFFVHFRDIKGNKHKFHETFHDNGQTDMAKTIALYKKFNVDVPVRVDHVPTMKGETNENAGYQSIGRLFAIGYLKGILDAVNM